MVHFSVVKMNQTLLSPDMDGNIPDPDLLTWFSGEMNQNFEGIK